jgi:hypothetical protein
MKAYRKYLVQELGWECMKECKVEPELVHKLGQDQMVKFLGHTGECRMELELLVKWMVPMWEG